MPGNSHSLATLDSYLKRFCAPKARIWICALPLLAASTALAQNGSTPNAAAGATTAYAINGLALGERVETQGSSFKGYACSASEQFPQFTRCQKAQRQPGQWPNRSFDSSSSILYGHDGKAVYINRYNAPWVFERNEVQTELGRLSARFGERARELRMPQRDGVTNAVIASWGKVQLEPLNAEAVAILAAGQSPRKGLLVDYLGDLQRSAKLNLPIYTLTGGAGFVWSSSADRSGRGHVRLIAADPSALGPAPAAAPPRPAETVEIAKTPVIETASAAPESEQVSVTETTEPVVETDQATGDKDASFDSVLARLEADVARLEARTAAIETFAYRTLFALFCAATVLAGFLLVRRSRARKAKARAAATEAVNLNALAQALQATSLQGDAFEQSGAALKETHSPALAAESVPEELVSATGAANPAPSAAVSPPSVAVSNDCAYEALSKATTQAAA